MNDIMKVIQALEDSGILLKGVSETIKNEVRSQKGSTLGMILGTIADSLLGNLLTGKGVYRTGYGNKQEIKKKGLIPAHPLTNIEIINYYENERPFYYSRDNLLKKKKEKMEHM